MKDISTKSQAIIDSLGCGFGMTTRGDQLKGYTPDDEGSVSKHYLDAKNCRELAEAFLEAAEVLESNAKFSPER